MTTYAALWGLGLVLVVVGFSLPLAGATGWFALLVAVGVALGMAGFLAFTKRDQETGT